MAARLIQGDCLEVLPTLAAGSVDLVFGSPPYRLARTYGIGFSLADQAWVDWMVAVVRASLRVCRGVVAFVVEGQTEDFRWTAEPVLLLADLHRAGVHLRKPPVYHRVGIPGSGGPDWLRNDYEFIVCATNGGKLPWSDNTALGHPPKFGPGGEMSHRVSDGTRVNQWGATGERSAGRVRRKDGSRPEPGAPSGKQFVKMGATRGYKNGDIQNEGMYVQPALANPGNVIKCVVGGGSMGSELAHENEAPFPEALAEFFIRSFCPSGGTVLDPFLGSGTTLAVAERFGRNGVGIDVRESQVALARRRLETVQKELFA